MIRPPSGWRWVLARVVPGRDREMLLDEMDRLFKSRTEAAGVAEAVHWYRSQVLGFVGRWPAEFVAGTARRVRREAGDLARLLRQTLRGLARAPGFTALATATLALGIGATAVIVGIADRALLRTLPYPEPDELVAVLDGWGASLGSIEILQREMRTVESLGGAVNAFGMTLEEPDAPARRVSVSSVSPEYLAALRVTPLLGRLFSAEEAEPGRGRVVLLGHEFWQAQFGGSSDALERSVTLDGERYDVVGVLPRGFDLPSSRNELWRPVVMDPSNPGLHWGAGNHTVLARMAAGVSPEQVRAELLRVQDQVRTANPLWTPNAGFWDEARVTPLKESRASGVRTPLVLLLGALGLVLLVVCANVASLFVARGIARTRERAVRSALGADGGRLAREQLLEVIVLGAAGLVGGLLVAYVGLKSIQPLLPAGLPGADQIALDLRVGIITGAIALLTAVSAGALPTIRVARQTPGALLREAGRTASVSGARRRMTRGLVAAQLAVAVVLVTGSGLLARTLVELGAVDPGFQPAGRVTAQVHVPPGLSADHDARTLYYEELQRQLEAQPELDRLAFATTIPFGQEDEWVAMAIDGVTTDPNDLPVLPHHRVTPAFFELAGISLVQGRGFDASDRSGTPPVTIVDEAFVHRFFQGENAIGRIVRYPWRGAPAMEIVGVVETVFHDDLAARPEPTVWAPLAQMGMGVVGHVTAVGVASGEVDAGLAALTRGARDMDDRIAVSDMAAYDQLLAESLSSTRLMTLLLLFFASTTLVLGCVGVYGVASYTVRTQLREIGVRMAIGAPAARIRRGVLRDGLRLAVPGAVVGVLLAIPAARALGGLLYGVATFDPITFLAAPIVLALTALLAVYVPARRASRVDPSTVLREE